MNDYLIKLKEDNKILERDIRDAIKKMQDKYPGIAFNITAKTTEITMSGVRTAYSINVSSTIEVL